MLHGLLMGAGHDNGIIQIKDDPDAKPVAKQSYMVHDLGKNAWC